LILQRSGRKENCIVPQKKQPVNAKRLTGFCLVKTGILLGRRGDKGQGRCRGQTGAARWQHFLYFLPLPQGQGSLRPTFAERYGMIMPSMRGT